MYFILPPESYSQLCVLMHLYSLKKLDFTDIQPKVCIHRSCFLCGDDTAKPKLLVRDDVISRHKNDVISQLDEDIIDHPNDDKQQDSDLCMTCGCRIGLGKALYRASLHVDTTSYLIVLMVDCTACCLSGRPASQLAVCPAVCLSIWLSGWLVRLVG